MIEVGFDVSEWSIRPDTATNFGVYHATVAAVKYLSDGNSEIHLTLFRLSNIPKHKETGLTQAQVITGDVESFKALRDALQETIEKASQ